MVAAATADLLPPAPNTVWDSMNAIVDAHRREDPARLDGSFAYACWSERRGLELAVDAFRTCPLVYSRIGDGIAFSSRIDCLRQLPGVSMAVDLNALVDYLSFAVIPAPRTFFHGIRKLRAAHHLVCGAHVGEPVRYWQLRYCENGGRSRDALAAELRERLAVAVRRHRGSGDGVGCFLSGGLDSSTVVGLAAQSGPCDAFTIGFDEARYDERFYAQITARHFGARYHERVVTPDDLADSLERVVGYFDEPFGNSSAIAVYQCARLAQEAGMTTLLAGDGGDELFAGNERYGTDLLFQRYHDLPTPVRGLLATVSASETFCSLPGVGKVGRYTRRARLPNPDRLLSYGLHVDRHLDEVLQPEILAEIGSHRAVGTARQLYAEGEAESELGRLLLFDHQLTLADNDLRKVTEACGGAGVRVRYPMLDRSVVELVAKVPSGWLLQGSKLRTFYKEAMADFLPREVLTKSKHGFGLPFASWLRTDGRLRERVGDLLESATSPLAQWIRPTFLSRLYQAHLTESEPYYADLLWPFITLSIWLEG
jgi:asparagine synthase (glutamine-hydrolysing)